MRYTGDKAREVLKYLLAEVCYKPDTEWDLGEEGRTVYRTLEYYLEHGYPRKPRYQLADGDYAVNEYGLCDGHYKDKNMFIAFDNTSGNCNVEEFEFEEDALKWLNNDYEGPEDFKGKTSTC
ncbi:hypothetical protein [Dysgonomonas sp. 520]|uniref:hypothetical protein n=1 Tax=Dysgonomonas sp. 520 TaxID=2302931 RepID=UPI0013D74E8C|nr:hypothetical protein [Dysgonomonas sp. 520]